MAPEPARPSFMGNVRLVESENLRMLRDGYHQGDGSIDLTIEFSSPNTPPLVLTNLGPVPVILNASISCCIGAVYIPPASAEQLAMRLGSVKVTAFMQLNSLKKGLMSPLFALPVNTPDDLVVALDSPNVGLTLTLAKNRLGMLCMRFSFSSAPPFGC